MSSVRPKLSVDAPRLLTAWDTLSGRTLYLGPDDEWLATPEGALVLNGKTAEEKLAQARAQETRILDPYFMQVNSEGRIAGREKIRENIRASGPSIHPHLHEKPKLKR